MDTWAELDRDEYDLVWDRFDDVFEFRPEYHERVKPAISEPSPFVTFNLADDRADARLDAVNALFLNAFRAVIPADGRMFVLDWQHTSYSYFPHRGDGKWPLGIYPDGDYFIFLADDFSFGTFGHPWQLSLCVFGQPLLNALDGRLHQLLNVVRSAGG
jgi:hypothetical protein